MKRPLMLVVALATMLCVGASSKANSTLATQSAEKPEASKPENKDVVKYLLSDSTLQNRIVAIPQFANCDLTYISVDEINAAKNDTLTVAANATEKPKVEIPKPIEKPEAIIPYPNKPFSRVISYGAGRNRHGKYSKECAAHANYRLQKFGIFSYGHAYQIPSHFPSVVNGYSHVTIAKSANFQAIMNMHRQAADYVKANLDISKLNPAKYYVVNMYYSTSPHMVEFFVAAKKQQTGNYATHVGVLYYDKKAQAWIVEHNIHGNVYRDALVSVLGGASNPHKYGVTSISRASK